MMTRSGAVPGMPDDGGGAETRVLADFAGHWSLQRRITGEPMAGHFVGEAVFTDTGGALEYAETGTLTLEAGGAFQAQRRYIWLPAPQGVEVLFADRRPFHVIDLREQVPACRHHCAPDLYDVVYDFRNWPDWSSSWKVSGPRKDYRMTTEYRRRS